MKINGKHYNFTGVELAIVLILVIGVPVAACASIIAIILLCKSA